MAGTFEPLQPAVASLSQGYALWGLYLRSYNIAVFAGVLLNEPRAGRRKTRVGRRRVKHLAPVPVTYLITSLDRLSSFDQTSNAPRSAQRDRSVPEPLPRGGREGAAAVARLPGPGVRAGLPEGASAGPVLPSSGRSCSWRVWGTAPTVWLSGESVCLCCERARPDDSRCLRVPRRRAVPSRSRRRRRFSSSPFMRSSPLPSRIRKLSFTTCT